MKVHHRLKHLPRKQVEVKRSDFDINSAVNRFLIQRKSQDCTDKTIQTYERALKIFQEHILREQIESVYDINIEVIERFMAKLNRAATYNQGGRHLIFRTVKTFLGWVESVSDGYTSPMWGFPAPRIEVRPLEGIAIEDVERMVKVCDGVNRRRDVCILLFLTDTGVRASELINMNLDQIDLKTGEVDIEKGKWRKSRTVIVGIKTRKALNAYLSTREIKKNDPVFVTKEGFRLTYAGLRQIIRRISERAGIDEPGLHDFRRLFAVTMHRNGVDDITLARFMGHTTTEVLKRYLAEDEQDLIRVHRTGSPIDNNLR